MIADFIGALLGSLIELVFSAPLAILLAILGGMAGWLIAGGTGCLVGIILGFGAGWLIDGALDAASRRTWPTLLAIMTATIAVIVLIGWFLAR